MIKIAPSILSADFANMGRCLLYTSTDHLDGLVYKRLVTEPPEGYSEDAEEDE